MEGPGASDTQLAVCRSPSTSQMSLPASPAVKGDTSPMPRL